MEFSVVIPTFNRASILEKTLGALAGQSFPGCPPDRQPTARYEVIVVDDGSSDDTAARVRSLQRRSRVDLQYLYQENRRQAAARNLGSRQARGRYLVFLGDDTVPAPDFLARHQAGHRRQAETVAVIGYTPWADQLPRTRFMEYIGERGWQFGFSLIQDPDDVPFNFLYTSNLSLSRDVFLETGGFDEDFQEYGWEDVELGWRLRQRGIRLVYRRDAVAQHHHPTTIASFLGRQRQVGRSAWTLYQKHPELEEFLSLDRLPHYSRLDQLRMALLGWACRLTERRRWPDLIRFYPDLLSYHYCRGVLDSR